MSNFEKLDKSYNGRGDPAVLTIKCEFDDHMYLDPLADQTIVFAIGYEVASKFPDKFIENVDYVFEGYHRYADINRWSKHYTVYVRFSDANALSYTMLKIGSTDFGILSYDQILQMIKKHQQLICKNS